MFIPHYVSCVMCHVSRVTCHLSPVTCHLSHVIFFSFSFHLTNWWSWSVEVLLSTEPTLSSLIHILYCLVQFHDSLFSVLAGYLLCDIPDWENSHVLQQRYVETQFQTGSKQLSAWSIQRFTQVYANLTDLVCHSLPWEI